LAIITMHTMPMISWSQRLADGAPAGTRDKDALVMVVPPSDGSGSLRLGGRTNPQLTFLNPSELRISHPAVNRSLRRRQRISCRPVRGGACCNAET
jgi:hypothetical protein